MSALFTAENIDISSTKCFTVGTMLSGIEKPQVLRVG